MKNSAAVPSGAAENRRLSDDMSWVAYNLINSSMSSERLEKTEYGVRGSRRVDGKPER